MDYVLMKYSSIYKNSLQDLLQTVGVEEYNHGPEWVEYFKNYDLESITDLYIYLHSGVVVSSGGIKHIGDNHYELVLFYTLMEHRGKGLSHDIYLKCLDSITTDTPYKLSIVTHREFSGYKVWLHRDFKEDKEEYDEHGNLQVFLSKEIK